MQTFIDSKELAKAKDVNNLFGQDNNFKLSADLSYCKNRFKTFELAIAIFLSPTF